MVRYRLSHWYVEIALVLAILALFTSCVMKLTSKSPETVKIVKPSLQ